jgi:hypothetical protein
MRNRLTLRLGFGPDGLTSGTVSNTDVVPTIVDNAYSQGLISSKVLGVYFEPISGSATTSNNGELTLGGVDSTKYSGSITYTPITSKSPSNVSETLIITEHRQMKK